MKNNNVHLILIICNHDYVDEVMAVARKAGAKGGTIIHGRGTVPEESKKFFGITIQPEKAVLMILANNEDQVLIMNSINEKAGIGSKAHAVSFSLEVSRHLGFKV